MENHKCVLPLISIFCLAAEPPDKRSKLSESESSDSEAVQLTECWKTVVFINYIINAAKCSFSCFSEVCVSPSAQ